MFIEYVNVNVLGVAAAFVPGPVAFGPGPVAFDPASVPTPGPTPGPDPVIGGYAPGG